jgi:hypothetical protein
MHGTKESCNCFQFDVNRKGSWIHQTSGIRGGGGNGLGFMFRLRMGLGGNGSALDGSGLHDVVVAALLLEELLEVVLAVENPFQRRVVGGRDGTAPMRAPEARLVVRLPLDGDLQCG